MFEINIPDNSSFNENVFAPFYYRVRPLIIWKREIKESFERGEITEKEYFDKTIFKIREYNEYINGK